MRNTTKWENFVNWVKNLRWYFECPHPNIVAYFTMDELLEDGWERISGAASCIKCQRSFMVSIAANKTERASEHYLGY